MHLFYCPDINDSIYTLDKDESLHALKVLRLSKGEIIQIINGKGGMYTAEIIETTSGKCTVQITATENEYEKRPFRLHMAVAPTKHNDRFEWFIEKAVEIGIDELTPVISSNSERKAVNLERLHRIVVAAAKQSIKAYMPKINEAVTFNRLITDATEEYRFIAHCNEGKKEHLLHGCPPGKSVLLAIGPEGDFTPTEVEQAIAKNFRAVTLGNSRLRTETAAVVACTQLNFINEI